MGKTLFILLFVFLGICGSLSAQELNARVTVNSDKIQGTNKQVYETLQKALTEFINTKKWTGATFAVNEIAVLQSFSMKFRKKILIKGKSKFRHADRYIILRTQRPC